MTDAHSDSCLLDMLKSLQSNYFPPSGDFFYELLKACGEKVDINIVRKIQSNIIREGFEGISVLADYLIRLFSSCGCLIEANRVFWKISCPTQYSWSSIILANARHGEGRKALALYHEMRLLNIRSNRCVFLAALKACALASSRIEGMLLHCDLTETGLLVDAKFGSTLIDMYGKCGCTKEALNVFNKLCSPNIICWNALIAGFSMQHDCFPALELFERMLERGIEPSKVTYSSICKACGGLKAITCGQLIHDKILRNHIELDAVIGGSLIDMYIKCGNIEEARRVFDSLPNRDGIVLHTMIAGYADNEYVASALELFGESQAEDSFPSLLKACGSSGSIGNGRMLHNQCIKNVSVIGVVIGSALVDMYAKCGSLDEAENVHRGLLVRNIVSWGALISAYARSANWMLAWKCLEKMKQDSLKPNEMIFSSLLAASCNMGLINEGRAFFRSMEADYSIVPTNEHYACMIDLLSHSGCLEEAENFLQKLHSNVSGWISLLSSCRAHGNLDMGKRCFEQVIQLDPDFPAAYEWMHDLYVKACMWDEAARIRKMRKQTNIWKKPGRAWIEVGQKVHEFVVNSSPCTHVHELFSKQMLLRRRLDENGYKPQLDCTLWPLLVSERVS
ncbi:hypothetical protein KP509_19G051600 [Ceratopteris richardii]|uniref:Pentatricopeptide repeat-containing protein n=1 Tax=Ceratopteris richardii TaxID=49495 RepID=A0A8T2SNJ0_CERRI|nr:hypothetical protein KP509_19G051600 [Ceratopteris richardii]